MAYVYVYTGPNSIEDGNFEVNGDELRLEHSGGGVSKCKLAPGEDPKTAACRLLREYRKERGTFWDPISYPPRRWV
jgi:hypothetical protein